MQENEASKISSVDKQRYFKIRKRTSQRILRVFAPSRESFPISLGTSRKGAKTQRIRWEILLRILKYRCLSTELFFEASFSCIGFLLRAFAPSRLRVSPFPSLWEPHELSALQAFSVIPFTDSQPDGLGYLNGWTVGPEENRRQDDSRSVSPSNSFVPFVPFVVL